MIRNSFKKTYPITTGIYGTVFKGKVVLSDDDKEHEDLFVVTGGSGEWKPGLEVNDLNKWEWTRERNGDDDLLRNDFGLWHDGNRDGVISESEVRSFERLVGQPIDNSQNIISDIGISRIPGSSEWFLVKDVLVP